MPSGNTDSGDVWSMYGVNPGDNYMAGSDSGTNQFQDVPFSYDQDWLSSFGYDGQGQTWEGNGNTESAQSSLVDDPRFQKWMQDKGYSFQRAALPGGDGPSSYLNRVIDSGGRQVGNTQRQEMDPENAFSMAVMAAAGGFAAPIALAGAGTAAAAGTGAALNAGQTYASGGSTGDILKAAATGGAGGYVASGVSDFNPGGYVTDNALGQSVINKAFTGGINTAIKGGNPLQGAALSGATAGASGMWDDFMGTIMGGQQQDPYATGGYSQAPQQNSPFADMMGYSAAPTAPTSAFASTFDGGFGSRSQAQGSGGGPYDADIAAMGLDTPMGSGAEPLPNFGGGAGVAPWQEYLKKNGANLFGGLASLYMGHRQANQLGKARSQLDQLYSPNSPYAAQMRSNLQRHDAASGRRSQAGPREMQLAAALTQARSGQLLSPQYQGLINGQTNANYSALGPLLSMYQRGTFNGLPGAVSSGADALSSYFGG